MRTCEDHRESGPQCTRKPALAGPRSAGTCITGVQPLERLASQLPGPRRSTRQPEVTDDTLALKPETRAGQVTVTTCRLEPPRCGNSPHSSKNGCLWHPGSRRHRGALRHPGSRRHRGARQPPAAAHGAQPHPVSNQGVWTGSRPHAIAGRLLPWPGEGSGVAVCSKPRIHPHRGQGAGQGDRPGTTREKANHPSPSPFSHNPLVQNTHRKMLMACSADTSLSQSKRTPFCADRVFSVFPFTNLPPTLNATSFLVQSGFPA